MDQLFELKNKTAVVTGGTGYLGRSIVEALYEAGAEVYITSKNLDKCKNFASQINNANNSRVKGMILDVTSTESIRTCLNKIQNDSGKIDVLVNNAVSLPKIKNDNITEMDWKTGLDGTINNVYRCTNEVIPIMEKTGNGSIINIASIYGVVSPYPSIYKNNEFANPSFYGAGKAAIIQFTRYTACNLAKKGIRVNAVTPGAFPNLKVQRDSLFISRLKEKIPLGRIGKPNEIKGVIVFLASDASSYVTGENIHVDGGWTAW